MSFKGNIEQPFIKTRVLVAGRGGRLHLVEFAGEVAADLPRSLSDVASYFVSRSHD
jgi:hypothetical protein